MFARPVGTRVMLLGPVAPGRWLTTLARARFTARVVSGKKISSAKVKDVARAIAVYANFKTGEEVRPGAGRISVDAECDVKTVERAMRVLVAAGFLWRVKVRARKHGEADEFWLSLPLGTDENVTVRNDWVVVLSPAEYEDMVSGKRSRTVVSVPGGPVDNLVVPVPEGPVEDGPPEDVPVPTGTDLEDVPVPGGTLYRSPRDRLPRHDRARSFTDQHANQSRGPLTDRAREFETTPPNRQSTSCDEPGCIGGIILTDSNDLDRCKRCGPD